MWRSLASTAVAILLIGAGCPGRGSGSAADGGQDVQDADAGTPAVDATLDAGDGGGTPYDFCGLSLFRLPLEPGDWWIWLSLWGDKVALSRKIGGVSGPNPQLYVLDLATCVERQLTTDAKVGGICLWDNNVFYDDTRYWDGTSTLRNIYMYDLDSGTEELLSDYPKHKWRPLGNDRFVVFRQDTQGGIGSPTELVLLDLQTRQEQVLAPEWAGAPYHAVSERYVTWTAYTQDPQSVGRDVFYYDLQNEETFHVASTAEGFQYAGTAWGDYITWFGSDMYLQDPYHLVLYHIPTGDSTVLVDSDGSARWAPIHRNLVVYNTNRYQGGEMMLRPSDIEIHDIDSGLRRRVTTEPSGLRATQLSFPYLVMMDTLESSDNNLRPRYVGNLLLLGLVDETGHLLPGDGVIEPPQ